MRESENSAGAAARPEETNGGIISPGKCATCYRDTEMVIAHYCERAGVGKGVVWGAAC